MDIKDLKDPELQEKLKACSTMEDFAELAKSQGVELSDEQVEAIAGGTEVWAWGSCDNQDFYFPM